MQNSALFFLIIRIRDDDYSAVAFAFEEEDEELIMRSKEDLTHHYYLFVGKIDRFIVKLTKYTNYIIEKEPFSLFTYTIC